LAAGWLSLDSLVPSAQETNDFGRTEHYGETGVTDDCDAIFMSIRQISRAVDVHSKRLAKTSGLSVPQLLVLRAVQKFGAAPIHVISRDVWLSQATVTTIIDRLETNGFLQRKRSADDRRVVHVVVSPAGEQKLELMPKLVQSDFVDQFATLDQWEQQMLMSSLDRVAQILNREQFSAERDDSPEDVENGPPARPADPSN